MDNELNYAKQTQFAGYLNEHKLLFQQSIMKINGFSGALKTNPNKANFNTKNNDRLGIDN